MIAALAGWLAERDLALGDLRTGRSLEEAYLAITGSRGDVEPARDRSRPEPADGRRRAGGRGGGGDGAHGDGRSAPGR